MAANGHWNSGDDVADDETIESLLSMTDVSFPVIYELLIDLCNGNRRLASEWMVAKLRERQGR